MEEERERSYGVKCLLNVLLPFYSPVKGFPPLLCESVDGGGRRVAVTPGYNVLLM